MQPTTKHFFRELPELYTKGDVINNFLPNAKFKWVPYIHACYNAPAPTFRDPFINALDEKFKGWFNLFKIPAKCCYGWHTDVPQKVAVNMVLDKFNSHTLFSRDNSNPDLYFFEELKYEPLRWYIFNTQVKHTVVNLGETDRILCSYRVPDEIDYETVVDWYFNEYQPSLEKQT